MSLAWKFAWPASLGIDIAVTYLVARFICGRTAAVPFLLLLAIVADALGFLVLGVFDLTRDSTGLRVSPVMTRRTGIAVGLRRARVKSFWPYVVLAGSISWAALYVGGPALRRWRWCPSCRSCRTRRAIEDSW